LCCAPETITPSRGKWQVVISSAQLGLGSRKKQKQCENYLFELFTDY